MLAPLLLVALSQSPATEETELDKAERLARELLGRSASASVDLEVHPAEGLRPHLAYDKEVWCTNELPKSKTVPTGAYRIQCDDETHVCLAAPNRVLHDGVASEEDLQRTAFCSQIPRSELERLGATHRFVEAVAEAPDGWFRDDQGRIIQVNFDLHRRVYFGGAYAPIFRPGPNSDLSGFSFELARGRADFGIEIELSNDERRELHRLHILEGSVWLGGNETRLVATGVRYDFSARRITPPLYLTTFFGKPRRVDLDINLSGWFETLHLELIGQKSYLTLATANAALDLWHSKDLQSYLRVRAGPGAELDLQTLRVYLKPEVAFEGDFTLDADGFHHVTAAVSGEKLFFDAPLEGRRTNPQRFKARVGYEVIMLAINDYPLTLVVDARAMWRDDLPNVVPGWDFGVDAGLRFSFWAPQRRTAVQVMHRG